MNGAYLITRGQWQRWIGHEWRKLYLNIEVLEKIEYEIIYEMGRQDLIFDRDAWFPIYRFITGSVWTERTSVLLIYLQCHDFCHNVVMTYKPSSRQKNPIMRGIHRSQMDSLIKGRSFGALIFSAVLTWRSSWTTIRNINDLRRHLAQSSDVIVLSTFGYTLLYYGYLTSVETTLDASQSHAEPLFDMGPCQIRNIAGCACAGNAGNVFPSTAG